MNLKETILTRRTHHHFSGEVVPQEIINQSIELALWAPNHKHTHPWIFYDLGPESRQKMIDLSVVLKRQKDVNLNDAIIEALKKKLGSVSHMIMIGLKLCNDSFQQREDYASVACGVQNMSLYLHEQGYGSKWTTGGFTSHSSMYETLGIDSKVVEIVGCLLVGVPESTSLRVPPRPEYTSVVHCRV